MALSDPSFAQTPPAPHFDESVSPVADQVPCMLTNNQNYAARSQVPGQLPPAIMLAEAAELRLKTFIEQNKANAPTAEALKTFAEDLRENYVTFGIQGLKNALPSIQERAATNSTKGLALGDPLGAQYEALIELKRLTDENVNQTPAFPRPKDVSCSMSIYSWDEVHKSLGRTIADTFLTVQITVRNLDGNNEFLVHDAEFAVDADSAWPSRFQVGNEKEVVRGVLQYGQNYDRQHVILSIADGIAMILGAIVPLPYPSSGSLNGASAVYHAGLLPSLHTIFPDLTTRNLNTLNDLAFSAANASRVVVPKSGSVPFLVFIPIKPLEQACWLDSTYNIYADSPLSSACEQVCSDGSCVCPNADNCKPPITRFKHWTPIQLQALGMHSYALIAGAHIKTVGQPAIVNNIKCDTPSDPSNEYAQYRIQGDLSCDLSGSNLDTLSILRFISPAEVNSPLDAKVTVSGDSTKATATLSSSDISKIDQTSYELFGVDKTGVPQDLNQQIKFLLKPTVSAGQSVPAAGTTANLKGSNLQNVLQVLFYDASNKTKIAAVQTDQTKAAPDSITFTVPAAATLPAGTTYHIQLLMADGTTATWDTNTTVTH
ncbi:MAG TPA: hypothetical protein VIH76_01410 [Candidatus Acidoferrales bacterium]